MAVPPKVTNFPPPPFQSPMFVKDPSGEDTENISWPWQQWLLAVTSALGGSISVTGSIASGAALKSLLQALQKIGLIVDNSTP